MYKQVPQTRGKVEYTELATPLSNKFYLGYEHGEIYGLNHSTTRFTPSSMKRYLRSKTPISGLYLTGQDIIACGISSAFQSGVFTAGAVLNRNVYGQVQEEAARRKTLFKATAQKKDL